MRIHMFAGLIVAGLFAGHGADIARAEDCGLKQYASLELKEEEKDEPIVPVMVNDTPRSMIVDVGGINTLDEGIVTALKMQEHDVNRGVKFFSGNGSQVTRFVTVRDLQVGSAHMPNWFALVASSRQAWADRGIAGVLGSDFLANFDLDFDFGGRKLNLFSQDHCEGKVVYWSGAYAEIPFEIDESRHIRLVVTLDGKDLQGILDTGDSQSTLAMSAARTLFGIDPDSAGVTTDEDGDKHVTLHALTIGGIAVQNPKFYLTPDKMDRAYVKAMGLSIYNANIQKKIEPSILIGDNILRKLHLYIAYKERKLYVTAAAAH